jgi:hypothetical protein
MSLSRQNPVIRKRKKLITEIRYKIHTTTQVPKITCLEQSCFQDFNTTPVFATHIFHSDHPDTQTPGKITPPTGKTRLGFPRLVPVGFRRLIPGWFPAPGWVPSANG